MVGFSKDYVDSSNWDRQCQRLACLLCDTTDQRIGCTYALILNRMYCILFKAKRQIELVGSIGPFARSFHECSRCMFSASVSARICRRSESKVVLGASLILYTSNQHATTSWIGLLCIKRTYISRRDVQCSSSQSFQFWSSWLGSFAVANSGVYQLG